MSSVSVARPVPDEQSARKRSRATYGRINGMQFGPLPRTAAKLGSIVIAKGTARTMRREGRRNHGTTTFHVTSRDITAARDEQPSLSLSLVRDSYPATKEPPFSIARSLSRNGPLDFTLRSRYKTISIPFRQRFRRRRDFRPIFPPGSGVLRGPLYLGHSGLRCPFHPFHPFHASVNAHRSNRRPADLAGSMPARARTYRRRETSNIGVVSRFVGACLECYYSASSASLSRSHQTSEDGQFRSIDTAMIRFR